MRGQPIIAPLNETLSSAETVLISILEFTSSSLTRKSATLVSPRRQSRSTIGAVLLSIDRPILRYGHKSRRIPPRLLAGTGATAWLGVRNRGQVCVDR